MSFKAKMLAFHAIAAATAALTTPSLADEISLKYQSYELDTPEAQKFWATESNFATPLGVTKPWAMIADVKINGLQDIQISQLFSSDQCGSQDCPIKVMQGKTVLTEDLACDATDFHFISDDGKYLVACDAVLPINPK